MKYLLTIIIIAILLGGGYWYGARTGWFEDTSPTNLPTAEEIERMEEIEDSSSTIAPNATPGTSVRPRGSTPRTPPTQEATTTNATSSSEEIETTETEEEDVSTSPATN